MPGCEDWIRDRKPRVLLRWGWYISLRGKFERNKSTAGCRVIFFLKHCNKELIWSNKKCERKLIELTDFTRCLIFILRNDTLTLTDIRSNAFFVGSTFVTRRKATIVDFLVTLATFFQQWANAQLGTCDTVKTFMVGVTCLNLSLRWFFKLTMRSWCRRSGRREPRRSRKTAELFQKQRSSPLPSFRSICRSKFLNEFGWLKIHYLWN